MPKSPPVLTPVSSNQEISKQTEHGLAVCVHTRDAGTRRFTCSTNIYGVVLPAAGEAAVRQTDRQTDGPPSGPSPVFGETGSSHQMTIRAVNMYPRGRTLDCVCGGGGGAITLRLFPSSKCIIGADVLSSWEHPHVARIGACRCEDKRAKVVDEG